MGKLSFDGQVAIITGAAQGLGKAYALLLASQGVKVVINDILKDENGNYLALKVADEINEAGGSAIGNCDSISTIDGVKHLKKIVMEHYGKIDILIHNAGIFLDKPLNELGYEDWEKTISVHLNGGFYLAKEICPIMAQNNYGRVLFITSSIGMFGLSHHISYSAAKMGVFGLAKSLNEELKDKNVLCNLLSPLAKTNQTLGALGDNLPVSFDLEDVAPMAVYLCSNKIVDGGRIYVAGGGYYSRIGVYEGNGVMLQKDERILESIDENMDKIADLKKAAYIDSIKGATLKLFRKTIAKK